MCRKLFSFGVIAIAVVLAVLASFWPQQRLADIIYISRFFDVMLPVLAVGALVKYLTCCSQGSNKTECGHTHTEKHE